MAKPTQPAALAKITKASDAVTRAEERVTKAVCAAYLDGHGVKALADAAHYSEPYIRKILKENKVTIRARGGGACMQKRKAVIAMFKAGMDRKEISNLLKTKQTTIDNVLAEFAKK